MGTEDLASKYEDFEPGLYNIGNDTYMVGPLITVTTRSLKDFALFGYRHVISSFHGYLPLARSFRALFISSSVVFIRTIALLSPDNKTNQKFRFWALPSYNEFSTPLLAKPKGSRCLRR